MKTEFRNRAFLPVVMPLAILGVIGAVVGLVALILLYVDRQGAVAIAILAAAGVLLAVSLTASQDRLDLPRKGAVALAGIAPLLAGGLVAAGVLGGLADEDRNINVEPHGPQFVIPGIEEDAPVLAADSLQGFCLPEECDGSTFTNEWAFSYQEAEQVRYAFDNRDSVAHNLRIYAVPPEELEGLDAALDVGALQDGTYKVITPGVPPDIDGGVAQTYQWEPPEEGAEEEAADDGEIAGPTPVPEEAYFVCTLHPSTMWGVVDISTE